MGGVGFRELLEVGGDFGGVSAGDLLSSIGESTVRPVEPVPGGEGGSAAIRN